MKVYRVIFFAFVIFLFQGCSPAEKENDSIDDCWTVDADQCDISNCRTIYANAFDASNLCFMNEEEAVGCVAMDVVDANAVTRALDIEGKCWFFSNLTIPKNWVSENDWSLPDQKAHALCQSTLSTKTCSE